MGVAIHCRSSIFFLIGLLCSLHGVDKLLAQAEVSFKARRDFGDFKHGYRPISVAVGDFNNDRIPDLAVANSGSNNVSILLGNGNGTFQAAQSFAVGTGPVFVAAGDFNADGLPDLAVTNSSSNAVTNSSSNNVSILINNTPPGGALSFLVPQTIAVGTNPRAIAIGDFNLDGCPDLAVANAGSGTISILLGTLSGKCTGAFQAPQNIMVGGTPYSLAVGDFNVNGKQDLAVANEGSDTVSILLGKGDGTFQSAPTAPPIRVGRGPSSITTGDFNGDGIQDLAVANSGSNNVSILLGVGDGTFHKVQDVAVGKFPLSVTVRDFNGDGVPDLAVANSGSDNVSILINKGDEKGTFAEAQNFGVGSRPTSVAVGDFNNDRIPDLAVANYASNTVSILVGNGDGAFPLAQNFEAERGPSSVTVGYFNGDKIQDLAVANFGSNTVSILLGKGDGTFGLAGNFGVGDRPTSVTVGDFNGDKIQDLAVANYFSNNVSVLIGKGDGTFMIPDQASLSVGRLPSSVTVGDFNGDGVPDLAVANSGSDNVSILINKGDEKGTFAEAQNFGVGSRPTSVAVGDFNGDKIPDLAVANFNSSSVSILLGNGDGTFRSAGAFGVGRGPRSVTVGDFNGDDKPDLAVANFASDDVYILLGNGNGTFQAAQKSFAVGWNPLSVTIGDFNGDKIQDLAVANSWLNNVSILLGNGDGMFREAQHFGAGRDPGSVTVGDFNGDDLPDLAVANYGSNDVTILLNNLAQQQRKPRSR